MEELEQKIEFINPDEEKRRKKDLLRSLLLDNIDKIISLLIAIGYLVFIAFSGNFDLGYLAIFFPVYLIWFGERYADETNRIIDERGGIYTRGGFVMSKSPGFLFKYCGWVLLLLPAVVALIVKDK